MADLLPGEHDVGGGLIITGREWAAETIREVANSAEYGSYPQHISAFDLGRAIGRALTNCDEEGQYIKLLRGINHYQIGMNR